MSIQAKWVYAYLVSCAGNDKQTYPTKEKMCYDLGIKKVDTLSKYIKQIQARGYIKIVKTKRDNLKYKNVYLIATDTRTIEIWKREFEEGKEIEEAEVVSENKKSLTYGEVKDNENKEVPTYDEVETNNLEKSIDNNIISDNEEKYNRKFIKDEENISNKCEDDDIEAKNKRLMEEEKVFVPNFNFKPNINADWD